MLPPHLAERTHLDSTMNDSPNIRGRMYPSTHRDHTSRLSFEWQEVKMEDAQVAAAAFYLISAYNYYLTYHRQRVRKRRQNRRWWMTAIVMIVIKWPQKSLHNFIGLPRWLIYFIRTGTRFHWRLLPSKMMAENAMRESLFFFLFQLLKHRHWGHA
jgi:hypothetical protein